MAIASNMLGWMTSLADETRARALRVLEGHELTVAELCGVLQAPQSTVSRHLKVLADDGWVENRREGTSRLYRMQVNRLEQSARRLWLLLREEAGASAAAEQDDRRLEGVLKERQSRSKAFFSSAAGKWDALRRELYGEGFDLAGLMGLLDDEWVVGDLGCGTGQMSRLLSGYVGSVIGVDESAVMLETAKGESETDDNVEYRQGDLGSLPIDDDELDAAVICLVLHHVAEPGAVLGETGRVLKEGGRLVVVDMLKHGREEYRAEMGHVWLGFDREEMEGWYEEAGFEGVRVHELPVASEAKGPALFAASGRKGGGKRNGKSRRIRGAA